MPTHTYGAGLLKAMVGGFRVKLNLINYGYAGSGLGNTNNTLILDLSIVFRFKLLQGDLISD